MDTNRLQQHIPEPISWLRASVASIPMVGSALDHLLFDKADAIRLKNLESAISSLSDQIAKTQEASIDKDWFGSEEAIAAFKILSDKVSYEADKSKVDALGRVVGTFGTKERATDPKKLSVIEHLSRLSGVQIKLLRAVASVPAKKKDFASGGLTQQATAIWSTDILNALKAGPVFWQGNMDLSQELEVLEAYNVIKRVQLFAATEAGFVLTSIGHHAASYLRQAGL